METFDKIIKHLTDSNEASKRILKGWEDIYCKLAPFNELNEILCDSKIDKHLQ